MTENEKAPAPEALSRLFFALWPDEAVRRRLSLLAEAGHRACSGRRTRPENIHLTLVFLGEVEDRRIAELQAVAAGVRAPAFELSIDTFAYWRHNRVAWAGPSETPQPLAQLVAQLEEGLTAAGFGFDRRPFVPHITLIRKALCRETPSLPCPVRWAVEGFVLARSVRIEDGASYQIIGGWPLESQT